LPAEASSEEVASTWAPPRSLAADIDAVWVAESARPHRKLFDGPICRLESLEAHPGRLVLRWSRLTYRPFFVLHMARPDLLAANPGYEVSPLGVSVLLHTGDRKILLGKRGSRVAFYPDRVHPIAGAVEPADCGDVVAACRREVREELHVPAESWEPTHILGIVEDPLLRQPEVVVAGRTHLTAEDVAARVGAAGGDDEHDYLLALPDSKLESLLASQPLVRSQPLPTPVCIASLQLWRVICLPEDVV
jgi:8-oxo-dGTP pyrophosphatase MutT (NUDIX family)